MKRIPALALGLSLLTAACADPVAPVTPTPVAPTITETFSDTLLQFGNNLHRFEVKQVGGMKVTISNIQPRVTIGFGVGTPGVAGCTLIRDMKATDGATTELAGTASVTGPFCIAVFDGGEITEPVTYTVTVLHS
jgi:hypothetical protein